MPRLCAREHIDDGACRLARACRSRVLPGYYMLLIDTSGHGEFALFAVQTQALGKTTKELPGGGGEKLTLNVTAMGRKEPAADATPE